MINKTTNLRGKDLSPFSSVMLVAMLVFTWSIQVAAEPIEDHYFGATLFVVQTGNAVSPAVGVNSLVEYESVYGRMSEPEVDHGYQAARLFFANGGQTLFVIDPQGTEAEDFSGALASSVGLPVDLVAIPGAACCSDPLLKHVAIMSALKQHVDASPNRFGLIDAPLNSNVDDLQVYRSAFTSEHTAIYAPWLILDGTEPEISVTVPPSSAVAGVISRIDREDGIYSTPAGPPAELNSPPVTQVGREFNNEETGSLVSANVNPLGYYISPLVVYVWGGRTTKDDEMRRYVAVSRFLRLLEFSISQSLNTALAAPPTANDASAVEGLIKDYLHGYWQQGALEGVTVNDAYFADCAIATYGLKCTVGAAVIRSAEFALIQLVIPYLGGPNPVFIFESGFEEN